MNPSAILSRWIQHCHDCFDTVLSGLAGGIGYIVYLAFTYSGVDPKVTVAIIYPFAATIAYLLNKKWTFSHEGKYWLTASLFVVAHLLSMLLNIMLL